MHEAPSPPAHRIHEVSPADRWERVKNALGVATHVEVAERTGVPLRTLHRLFDNPDTSEMRHALRVSARTGIAMDELFPPADLVEAA